MEESSNVTNGETLKVEDSNANSAVKNCTLCGCSTPAVKCDKCGSQVFCLSCDDMYHRHPKRRFHLRKAVDSIWNTHRSPRLRRRTELPGDPSKIPIPPPRSKKRHATLGAFSSPFDMQMFGYKNPWAQKRGMEPQRDIRNRSPHSMETNTGAENETNSAEDNQLQRRNSADNPNSISDSSSPIHVMVPGAPPVQMRTAEGMTLGYPQQMAGHGMHHSMSATDLSGVSSAQPVPPYYQFPQVHGFMHPHMPPYHPSMGQFACPQCVSSSWSNLMSPTMAHFHQHPQQWPTTHSPLSKSSLSPENEAMARQNQSPMSGPMHFPGSYMIPPGAYAYNAGASPQGFTPEPPVPSATQKQSPLASQPATSHQPETSHQPDESQTSDPQIVSTSDAANPVSDANAEAVEEEEEEVEEEEELVKPEKPTNPWECMHCTYVNAPGSHICEICCKTSYEPPKKKKSKKMVQKAVQRAALLQSPTKEIEEEIPMDVQEEPYVEHSQEKNIAKVEESEVIEAEESEPQMIEAEESEPQVVEAGQSEPQAPETIEVASPEVTEAVVKDDTSSNIVTTKTVVETSTAEVQTEVAEEKTAEIATETEIPIMKREMCIQTELEDSSHKRTIATDPMISSQSMESLLSGVSAPPYHNRRAGNSFSTQSLSAFERGRSRSPMPRSSSAMGDIRSLGRGIPIVFQDPVGSAWTHSWLSSDPMYYKPHALAPSPSRDDYYDGNWGSMDRLNRNAKKTEEEKWKQLPGKPRYHKSLENLKIERVPDPPFIQCLKKVKDAERCGYSVEDLQVAYFNCRNDDPIFWLQENWDSLVKNVISLAAKCAEDNEEHDVGAITPAEAKYTLHKYRGNIWEAVAECIELRQRKILELTIRGNFSQKQIVEALKNNDGNVELAYADLIRTTTKLFKHILSPGLSEESEDISIQVATAKDASDRPVPVQKQGSTEDEDFGPDKKRSDFLNKLTAVREAQSERRKAREEKTRDTDKTTKEEEEEKLDEHVSTPPPDAIVESISEQVTADALKEGVLESVELQPSSALESSQFEVIPDEMEQGPAEEYANDAVVIQSKKEDELPEDFDGHWVDSQGEWIEEFSDEQWDEEGEGEGEWVTVRTRYKKMDDELDAEALEMAALWEKEELADDVFEEEPKQQKLTPEKDLELKEALQSELEGRWSGMDVPPTEISLQHYPQEYAEEEFEMDANDNWIVKDAEKLLRSPENEMYVNEDDKAIATDINEDNMIMKLSNISREIASDATEAKGPCDSLEGSIGDEWEKVETHKSIDSLTEELKLSVEPHIETSELKLSVEPHIETSELKLSVEPHIETSEFDKQASLDQTHITETQEPAIIPLPPKRRTSSRDIGTTIEAETAVFVDFKPIQPESPTEGPVPPVRRKSKLSDTEVKQVLEKHTAEDTTQEALHNPLCFDVSPCLKRESSETGVDESHKSRYPLREISPGPSFSGESDSNCFADSESEEEINIRKLKKHHHRSEMEKKDLTQLDNTKPMELDQENVIDEDMEKLKMELEMKSSFAKKSHMLEDEEPMYRPFSGPIVRMRSQESTSSLEEGQSQKAYRGDVGRPLQLFKEPQQASYVEDNVPVDESIFHSASDALVFEEAQVPAMQDSTQYTIPSYVPDHTEPMIMNQATDQFPPTSQIPTENIITDQGLVTEEKREVIPSREVIPQLPPQMEDAFGKSQAELEYHETLEDMPALSEMEATSAVADYFFGRYNEITVTRKPKKKPILIKGPGTSIKPMSTSVAVKKEATPIPSTDSTVKVAEKTTSDSQELSSLSKSVAETGVSENFETGVVAAIQPISTPHQLPQLPHAIARPATPVGTKTPEPAETLSFAEDYFFGSYNEVTVQKKPKKKPIPFLAKSSGTELIPASASSPPKKTFVRSSSSENISRSTGFSADNITQSATDDNVPSMHKSPHIEEQQREITEAAIKTSQNIVYQANIETTTAPIEIAEPMILESGQVIESSRIGAIPSQPQAEPGSKMKSVSFGQIKEIAAPPRGKKIKKDEGQPAMQQRPGSNVQPQPEGPPMSAADEYLYGRYDEILSQQKKGAPVSKKKLPSSIEDLEQYSSCAPCDSDLPITHIKPLSEIARESLLSSGTDSLQSSEIQLLEVEEVSLDSINVAEEIFEATKSVAEEQKLDLEKICKFSASESNVSDALLSSVSSNVSEISESWQEVGIIRAPPVDDSAPVTSQDEDAKELQTAGQLIIHPHSQGDVDESHLSGEEILLENINRNLQIEETDNKFVTDEDLKARSHDAEEGIGLSSELSIDELKADVSKEFDTEHFKTSLENLEIKSKDVLADSSDTINITDINANVERDTNEKLEMDSNLKAAETDSKINIPKDIERDIDEALDNFEVIHKDTKSSSESEVAVLEDLDTARFSFDSAGSETKLETDFIQSDEIGADEVPLEFEAGAPGDSEEDIDEMAEQLEADLEDMKLVLEQAIDEAEEGYEFGYTEFERDFDEEEEEEDEDLGDDTIEWDKNGNEAKGHALSGKPKIALEELSKPLLSIKEEKTEDNTDASNVPYSTDQARETVIEVSSSVEGSSAAELLKDQKISAHASSLKVVSFTEEHQLDENGNRADTEDTLIIKSSKETVQELQSDYNIITSTEAFQSISSVASLNQESQETDAKDIVTDDFDYGAAEMARDIEVTEDEEEEESSECTTIFIKSSGITSVDATTSDIESSVLEDEQSSLKREEPDNVASLEENVSTPVCDKLIKQEITPQLEKSIISESGLPIDVHIVSTESQSISELKCVEEVTAEIASSKAEVTSSVISKSSSLVTSVSEENVIVSSTEVSEKDESMQSSEDVPYDDSYSSVINRFYEEFIESAHPYSSTLVEDKPLAIYSSSYIELEDSSNEISEKPLKSSLQASECSNDSFDSIEEIDIVEQPYVDTHPLFEDIEPVRDVDLTPVSQRIDDAMEFDDFKTRASSDHIPEMYEDAQVHPIEAEQQTIPQKIFVTDAVKLDEKSELEISTVHQKITKTSDPVSKSSTEKRSLVTMDQSCQTELDVEDDQFYDTLDDDLLQEWLQNSGELKCVLVETGIQCQIIDGSGMHRMSIDNTAVIRSAKRDSQTITYISKSGLPLTIQDKMYVSSDTESGLDSKHDSEDQSLQESNSFESLADDDSDIFIEMANSESDDSTVPRGHMRLLDIDSGTGSISGSDTENYLDTDIGSSQLMGKIRYVTSDVQLVSSSSEGSITKHGIGQERQQGKPEKQLSLGAKSSSTTDQTTTSYRVESTIKSSTAVKSSEYVTKEETLEKSKLTQHLQHKKEKTEAESNQESFNIGEEEESFKSLDISETEEMSLSESIADGMHKKPLGIEVKPKFAVGKEKVQLSTSVELSSHEESKKTEDASKSTPSIVQKEKSSISEVSAVSSNDKMAASKDKTVAPLKDKPVASLKDKSAASSEADIIELAEPKCFTYVRCVSPSQPILRIPTVLDVKFIEIQHPVIKDAEEKETSNETDVRASSPTVEYFLPSSPEPSSASEDSSAFKDAVSKHRSVVSDLSHTPSATPDLCPDVFAHMDLPSSHSEEFWEEAHSSAHETGENFTDISSSSFFTDKSSLLDSDQCSTASGSIDDFELPFLDSPSGFEATFLFPEDKTQVKEQDNISKKPKMIPDSNKLLKETNVISESMSELKSTSLETKTKDSAVHTKKTIQKTEVVTVHSKEGQISELKESYGTPVKQEGKDISADVYQSRMQKSKEDELSIIPDTSAVDKDEPESELADISYHSAADTSEKSGEHSDDESEEFLSSADDYIRKQSLLKDKASSDVKKCLYYGDANEFDESEKSEFFESDSKLAQKEDILHVTQTVHDMFGTVSRQEEEKDTKRSTESVNVQRKERPSVERSLLQESYSTVSPQQTKIVDQSSSGETVLKADSMLTTQNIDKSSFTAKENSQAMQTIDSQKQILQQKEPEVQIAKTIVSHSIYVSEVVADHKSISTQAVQASLSIETTADKKITVKDNTEAEISVSRDEPTTEVDEFSDVPSHIQTAEDTDEFKDLGTEQSIDDFNDEEDSLAILDFEEVNIPKDESVHELVSTEIPEFDEALNLSQVLQKEKPPPGTELSDSTLFTDVKVTDVDSPLVLYISGLDPSDKLPGDSEGNLPITEICKSVQKVESSHAKIMEDKTEKMALTSSETLATVSKIQQHDANVAVKDEVLPECKTFSQPPTSIKEIEEANHEADISIDDEFADVDSYVASEISLSEELDHSDHSLTCDIHLLPDVQSVTYKQSTDQEMLSDAEIENIPAPTPYEVSEAIPEPLLSYLRKDSDFVLKSHVLHSEIQTVVQDTTLSSQSTEEIHEADVSRDDEFADVDSYVASEMSVSEELDHGDDSFSQIIDSFPITESIFDIKDAYKIDIADEKKELSSLIAIESELSVPLDAHKDVEIEKISDPKHMDILQSTLQDEQREDEKDGTDFSVGEEFSDIDSYVASQMSVSEEIENADTSSAAIADITPARMESGSMENEIVDFQFESCIQNIESPIQEIEKVGISSAAIVHTTPEQTEFASIEHEIVDFKFEACIQTIESPIQEIENVDILPAAITTPGKIEFASNENETVDFKFESCIQNIELPIQEIENVDISSAAIVHTTPAKIEFASNENETVDFKFESCVQNIELPIQEIENVHISSAAIIHTIPVKAEFASNENETVDFKFESCIQNIELPIQEIENVDISSAAIIHTIPVKAEFASIENEIVDFKFESCVQNIESVIPIDQPSTVPSVESSSELVSKSRQGSYESDVISTAASVSISDTSIKVPEVNELEIVNFKGNFSRNETEISTDVDFGDASCYSETDISEKLSTSIDVSFKDTEDKYPMKPVVAHSDLYVEKPGAEIDELPKLQKESQEPMLKATALKGQKSSVVELKTMQEIEISKGLDITLPQLSSDVFIEESSSKKTLETMSDLDEDEFADAPLEATHSDDEWKDVESDLMLVDFKGKAQLKTIEHLDAKGYTSDISVPTEAAKHSHVKPITVPKLKRLSATDSEACFAEECELATDPEEVMVLHTKSILHEPKQATVFDVIDALESDQKLQGSLPTKSSDEFTKSSMDKADTIADFSEMSEISDFPTDSNEAQHVTTISEMFTSQFGAIVEFSKEALFSNLSASYATGEEYEQWEDVETDNSMEFEEGNQYVDVVPQQQFLMEEMQGFEYEVSPDYAASFYSYETQAPLEFEEQIQYTEEEFLLRFGRHAEYLEGSLIVQTGSLLKDEEITTASLHSDIENVSESMISSMTGTNDYAIAKVLDSACTSATEKSYESIQTEEIKEFYLPESLETATELPTSCVSESIPPLPSESSAEPEKDISQVSELSPDIKDIHLSLSVDSEPVITDSQKQGVKVSTPRAYSVPEVESRSDSIYYMSQDFIDASSKFAEMRGSEMWAEGDENDFIECLRDDNGRNEKILEEDSKVPVFVEKEKLDDIQQIPLSTHKKEEIDFETCIETSTEVISPMTTIPSEKADASYFKPSEILDASIQKLDETTLTSQSSTVPSSTIEDIESAPKVSIPVTSELLTKLETLTELSGIKSIQTTITIKEQDETSIPEKGDRDQKQFSDVETKTHVLEESSLEVSKSVSQSEIEIAEQTVLKQAAMKEVATVAEMSAETSVISDSSILTESSLSKSDNFYDISSQVALTEELDSQDFESDSSVQDFKDEDSSVKEMVNEFSATSILDESKHLRMVISDTDIKSIVQEEEILEVAAKKIELSNSEILIGAQKLEISEVVSTPVQALQSAVLDTEVPKTDIVEVLPEFIEKPQLGTLDAEIQETKIPEVVPKRIEMLQAEVLDAIALREEILTPVPESVATLQFELLATRMQKIDFSESVGEATEVSEFEIIGTGTTKDKITDATAKGIEQAQSERLDAGGTQEVIITETALKSTESPSSEVLGRWTDDTYDEYDRQESAQRKFSQILTVYDFGSAYPQEEIAEESSREITDDLYFESKEPHTSENDLESSSLYESWSERSFELDENILQYEQETEDEFIGDQLVYDIEAIQDDEEEAILRAVDENLRKFSDRMTIDDEFRPSPDDAFPPSPDDVFAPSPDDVFAPSPDDVFAPSPDDFFAPSPDDVFAPSPDDVFAPSPDNVFAPSPDDEFCASPADEFNVKFDQADVHSPHLDTFAATSEFDTFDPNLDDYAQYEHEDSGKMESFVTISDSSTTQSKELFSVEEGEKDEYTADTEDFSAQEDKYLLTDILEESSIAESQHSAAFQTESQNEENVLLSKRSSEVFETGIFVARPVNVIDETIEQNITISSDFSPSEEMSISEKETLTADARPKDFSEIKSGITDLEVKSEASDYVQSDIITDETVRLKKIADKQRSSENEECAVSLSIKREIDKSFIDEKPKIPLQSDIKEQCETGEAKLPKIDDAKLPQIDEAKSPKINEVKSLKTDDAKSLKIDEAESPKIDEIKSLKTDEAESPKIDEVKSLKTDEVKLLKIDEAESPKIDEIKSLKTDEAKLSKIDEAKSPKIDEAKSLKTDKVKSLETDEVKSLETDEVKSLETDEAESLKTDEAKSLKTDETKSLKIDETKSLETDEVKSLKIGIVKEDENNLCLSKIRQEGSSDSVSAELEKSVDIVEMKLTTKISKDKQVIESTAEECSIKISSQELIEKSDKKVGIESVETDVILKGADSVLQVKASEEKLVEKMEVITQAKDLEVSSAVLESSKVDRIVHEFTDNKKQDGEFSASVKIKTTVETASDVEKVISLAKGEVEKHSKIQTEKSKIEAEETISDVDVSLSMKVGKKAVEDSSELAFSQHRLVSSSQGILSSKSEISSKVSEQEQTVLAGAGQEESISETIIMKGKAKTVQSEEESFTLVQLEKSREMQTSVEEASTTIVLTTAERDAKTKEEKGEEAVTKDITSVEKDQQESQIKVETTEQQTFKIETSTEISKDEEKPPALPRKRPNIQNVSESEEQEDEIPPALPRKTSRHRLSLSEDQKSSESQPLVEKEAQIDPPVVARRRRSSSLKSEESVTTSQESVTTSQESVTTSQESEVQPPTRRRRSRQSDAPVPQESEPEDLGSKTIMPRRISYDDERTILSRKDKLRVSIEERMSVLQTEGKCLSREKAFIAAKLIEMQFEEEDALTASKQCTTVYHAIKFLTQLCELCNCRFPVNLMASMSHCPHKACRECLRAHFTTLIYDRNVFSLLCPVCRKPDISDSNIQEYFNHLDMMLRRILRPDVYDLFQRKLRDEVLTKDPNFHWCSQCSNGFIASPRLKKLYCPECSAITCALCHQTWELEHEGVHCERFQQWKDMHTPEPPPAGLVKKLADRGVTCPSCGIKYPHACGGCMSYKCAHCSHKFCGFCRKPYLTGVDCKESPSCKDQGLHAHHPYNCLSFLRDIEHKDFQKLLTEAKVTYATIPAPDQIVKTRCQVREQKHLHGIVTEDRCLRDIVPYFAGLCRVHYMEYLAEMLRYQKISPLPIMTTMDLQFILRKSRIFIPEKIKGETLEEYHTQLQKLVTSKVSL